LADVLIDLLHASVIHTKELVKWATWLTLLSANLMAEPSRTKESIKY